MEIKLNTGIPEDNRKMVCEELNKLLANVYVTFVQARNFHWNVTGKNFNDLHSKFSDIYSSMDTLGDDLAERIRALDGMPNATMSKWLEIASLKEVSGKLDAEAMVVVIISNLEAIVTQMRNLVDEDEVEKTESESAEDEASEFELDYATETFIGDKMVELEKEIWKLRSFLA